MYLSLRHKDVPVCLTRGALMVELYQFYFSHYCEKARWALHYKGMSFTARNLLPGLYTKATSKLAPKTCMPIIVDGEQVVQDSTAIINYLDEKYPHRLLTPRDPSHAKAALKWEEYLDEEIGVTLRLWFYYHTLPNRDRALRFILDGGPWYGRPLFVLIFPKVRDRMMALMNINAVTAKQAEDRLLAALKQLDDALDGRAFSREMAFPGPTSLHVHCYHLMSGRAHPTHRRPRPCRIISVRCAISTRSVATSAGCRRCTETIGRCRPPVLDWPQ
jgi:glutathione S-transferase